MKTLETTLTRRQFYKLKHQAKGLHELQQRLYDFMDHNLTEHCWIGSYQRGQLKLITDSAAWATRIRYSEQQLMQQLKTSDEFTNLAKISCKVSPKQTIDKSTKHRQEISANSAAIIAESAAIVTDQKLSQALKKLAQNTNTLKK